MFGHDFRNQEQASVQAAKSDMLKADGLQLSNAIRTITTVGSKTNYRSENYMGELRYYFDEKYFAIVNGSVFGSSYFAPGH